jgi:hypothetical protein
VKRIGESNQNVTFNEGTVGKDFTVFINLYKNDSESKNVEDSFSGILSEIGLLNIISTDYRDEKGKPKKKEEFLIPNDERDNLPEAVLLFAILDNPNYGNSISLNSLEFDFNSEGSIFALNRSGLVNKINGIVAENRGVTFSDQAGIKELQFKEKPGSYKILDQYYGK